MQSCARDKVLPWRRSSRAHVYVEKGHKKGHVVLAVAPPPNILRTMNESTS